MSTVVIDSETAAKLEEQSGEVEVRTSDGRLVGLFTPLRDGMPEDYEWARQHFTKEEIEAARNEQGGYTTAEVLTYLQSLNPDA
jgi:hypothetical protein